MNYYIDYRKEGHDLLEYKAPDKSSLLIPKLPSGLYKAVAMHSLTGNFFRFYIHNNIENLIKFNSGTVDDVIKCADKFFSDESVEKYKKLDVAHKEGIILYGPHGTGKTSCANLIMKTLVEKYEAIALDCTGLDMSDTISFISKIRESNGDVKIIIFMDEVEMKIYQEENRFLHFLDGTDSFSNILFIGCTNYLDKIPDRIKFRKSRIRHLFEVKNLPYAVYKEYVNKKLQEEQDLVKQELAYKAHEKCLSIDQFKNAIIDYFVNDDDIDTAIDNSMKFVPKEP